MNTAEGVLRLCCIVVIKDLPLNTRKKRNMFWPRDPREVKSLDHVLGECHPVSVILAKPFTMTLQFLLGRKHIEI